MTFLADFFPWSEKTVSSRGALEKISRLYLRACTHQGFCLRRLSP
jgi:hypothetical protein